MNFQARIDELKKQAPPKKWRAEPGQWIPYAWQVRALREDGYGVIDAVRTVVDAEKLEPRETAIVSIRQAYYNLKNKPWPEEYR